MPFTLASTSDAAHPAPNHRLPERDVRSRTIVAQMQADEARHGAEARDAGAALPPSPIRALMRRTARFMTEAAYRL